MASEPGIQGLPPKALDSGLAATQVGFSRPGQIKVPISGKPEIGGRAPE
jgi:hypothetical protein